MKKEDVTLEKEFGQADLEFQAINGKRVSLAFDEPELTSDAGLLAVSQFEKEMGLIERLAGCVRDRRLNPVHDMEALIGQRIHQIISGNPDGNDSDRLRNDAGLQSAVGRECPLASQPTMSRLDNSIGNKDLIRMAYALGDLFLDSFETAPKMIIIDMDPTAHLVYGQQQLGLFNTHVGDTCLMPFHVYDGLTGRLITTVIREGKTPTASEILSLLKRIVKHIRARFPKTTLVFRADSHHTKPALLDWMRANKIEWVTGLGPNQRLNKDFANIIEQARQAYEENRLDGLDHSEVRLFASGCYGAQTWSRKERVICRVIAGPMGVDTRYIVTSFETAKPQFLYEEVYCDRGNAELFIKDHKLGLESDRSPCNCPKANQFRLFLHSAAYVILHRFREKMLVGTKLAKSTFQQIRIKLLKVAGRVKRMKTRIRFHLPLSFEYKEIFVRVAKLFATENNPSP
jgi:hypothetical protein